MHININIVSSNACATIRDRLRYGLAIIVVFINTTRWHCLFNGALQLYFSLLSTFYSTQTVCRVFTVLYHITLPYHMYCIAGWLMLLLEQKWSFCDILWLHKLRCFSTVYGIYIKCCTYSTVKKQQTNPVTLQVPGQRGGDISLCAPEAFHRFCTIMQK